MIKDFFINPATVINRSPTDDAHKIFSEFVREYGGSNGCQCVNCRSCDNSCNK